MAADFHMTLSSASNIKIPPTTECGHFQYLTLDQYTLPLMKAPSIEVTKNATNYRRSVSSSLSLL